MVKTIKLKRRVWLSCDFPHTLRISRLICNFERFSDDSIEEMSSINLAIKSNAAQMFLDIINIDYGVAIDECLICIDS